MTISAGTITLTPTGNLALGTDTNTNKIEN